MDLASNSPPHTIIVFKTTSAPASNLETLCNKDKSPASSSQRGIDDRRKILASTIVTFFKVAYYQGLTPFFIRHKHGIASISTWWLSKVSWIIIQILCLLLRTAESRLILNDLSANWSPNEYFKMTHAILKMVFHLVVWYYMWFKSDNFLQLVQFIYDSRHLPIPRPNIITRILPSFACIACAAVGAVVGTNSHSLLFNCDSDFKKMFRFLTRWGKYAIFLSTDKDKSYCDEIQMNTTLTGIELAIGIGTGIGTFFRQLHGVYEELLMPTCVCVFWLCSCEFSKRLESLNSPFPVPPISSNNNWHPTDTTTEQWKTILDWYVGLKGLSILIKDACGTIMFHRLILMIVDVPINYGGLKEMSDQLRFSFVFLPTTATYIFAADAVKQVRSLQTWISNEMELNENHVGISHPRLSMVLHELQTNTVGIIAGNAGFTITYSLVANVAGVLITYFIICVQYRNDM